ncbi:hypothetical protein AVEN_114995-1 [Araneus ventricosus]|uniref:Uncharacterized protein n=1 Tax=Araneus ventricosus TaxID=182803 RepID=A0A4Y1ZXW1_ARAVE|nr:hypothetical protein AVEN_114995-1 [Araneus ventricosus]
MFIFPALLYIKVLSLFGQCLYYLIAPNKSRPPHAGETALSPRSRPVFLGRPGQCGYLCGTPARGRLATTYDLACKRQHTRRIFEGMGFRACDPPVRRWRPCH